MAAQYSAGWLKRNGGICSIINVANQCIWHESIKRNNQSAMA